LAYCPQRLVGVAIDDTKLKKTGRSIPQDFYQRDSLSPPFHVDLVLDFTFDDLVFYNRLMRSYVLLDLKATVCIATRSIRVDLRRPGQGPGDRDCQL